MKPAPVSLRAALIAAAIVLGAPATALAVIPGLAPSLVAILPQILILSLMTIALVLSPRAWWRLAVRALRHPLRSSLVVCVGAALMYGSAQLVALLPRPAPGEPIPDAVEGFPLGDLHAARCRASGPGPVRSPQAVPAPAFPSLGARVNRLAVFGDQVLLILEGGEEVACADPAQGRIVWRRMLGSALLAGPIGFERLPGTEAPRSGLVAATAARTPTAAAELCLLHGADGALLGRVDLPATPSQHLALVDDLALVVLQDSVVSYHLSGPGAPRIAWSARRPAREPRGIAGDPSGRFFLLDEESLLGGSLRDGSIRELVRFEPGSPVRLAVRDSRPCVLTMDPRNGALLHGIDPSPRPRRPDGFGGAVVWSVDAGWPVGLDLSIGDFGVVLTLPGELRILDRWTGRVVGTFPLEAVPLCPAAVGDNSVYLLLEGGRVLRYAAGLGRLDRLIDVPVLSGRGDGPASGELSALAVAGDRLLAGVRGSLHIICERAGPRSLPWSHFRGGADRAGTCDGTRMPLAAKILWRRVCPGSGEVSVLPLPEGWLIAAAGAGRTHFSWLDDEGALLAERPEAGQPMGAVRMDERIFAAMALNEDEGALVCLSAERRAEGAFLRQVWKAPSQPLGGARPIALGGDLVINSLRSSLLAISASDGSRRWESKAAGGARSPLVAGGRVFAPIAGGDGAEPLAALSALDGRLLWKQEQPGSRWGPATLWGESILAPAERDREGTLFVLRPEDGSVIRSIPLPGEVPAGTLAAVRGAVCYAGRSGGAYFLPLDGKERLPIALGGNCAAGGGPLPPILGFDLVVFAVGSSLRCIDSLTRDAVWDVALPAPPVEAALERGRILVAAGEEVFCLGAD